MAPQVGRFRGERRWRPPARRLPPFFRRPDAHLLQAAEAAAPSSPAPPPPEALGGTLRVRHDDWALWGRCLQTQVQEDSTNSP